MTTKAWKHDDAKQPAFPDEFEVVKKVVLQRTDLEHNNNKYYALERHEGKRGGDTCHRVFTHYGRTDDLEANPEAGARECRYFEDAEEAKKEFDRLLKAKTGPSKGYREVALASARIGSARARGQSAGEVDPATVARAKSGPPSTLPAELQALVSYLYSEATQALTTTVAATITAEGIETPLGILTLGQIEQGEAILAELYAVFQTGQATKKQLDEGSGAFYSAIPHRLGRQRGAIAAAVIDSPGQFSQKQETLQLMKDMLRVNGEHGSVLFDSQVDLQFRALGCELSLVPHASPEHQALAEYVVNSQVKSKKVEVVNVFSLKRPAEHEAFRADVGNERRLFHGSRITNWVGLLSRGMLMPKLVVSMGGNRTDAGWLGNGLYFSDAACAAAFYTTEGKKRTRFMAVARVALGEVKDYTKITYGLNAPPPGYHSTHGVRRSPTVKSAFDDNEYVIYDPRQQRLESLVEFTV